MIDILCFGVYAHYLLNHDCVILIIVLKLAMESYHQPLLSSQSCLIAIGHCKQRLVCEEGEGTQANSTTFLARHKTSGVFTFVDSRCRKSFPFLSDYLFEWPVMKLFDMHDLLGWQGFLDTNQQTCCRDPSLNSVTRMTDIWWRRHSNKVPATSLTIIHILIGF